MTEAALDKIGRVSFYARCQAAERSPETGTEESCRVASSNREEGGRHLVCQCDPMLGFLSIFNSIYIYIYTLPATVYTQ